MHGHGGVIGRPGFPGGPGRHCFGFGGPVVYRRHCYPVRPYCGSGFGFGFGFYSGTTIVQEYPIYQPYPVYMPYPVYEPMPVAEPAPVYTQPPAPEEAVAEPPAEAAQPQMSDNQAYADQTPANGYTEPPQGAPPAQRTESDQPRRMSEEQAQTSMTEAVEAFGRGDYDRSARTFLQVAMAVPDNVDAWLAYAVARFACGEYQMAAGAIRRGLRQAPDVADAPFDIRDRYGITADFEKQLKALEQFVLQRPGDADGWLVLGFVRHFSSQRELAARTFEVIRQRYPADAELARAFLQAKQAQPPEARPEPPSATQPAESPAPQSQERQQPSESSAADRAVQQEADAVQAGIAAPPRAPSTLDDE